MWQPAIPTSVTHSPCQPKIRKTPASVEALDEQKSTQTHQVEFSRQQQPASLQSPSQPTWQTQKYATQIFTVNRKLGTPLYKHWHLHGLLHFLFDRFFECSDGNLQKQNHLSLTRITITTHIHHTHSFSDLPPNHLSLLASGTNLMWHRSLSLNFATVYFHNHDKKGLRILPLSVRGKLRDPREQSSPKKKKASGAECSSLLPTQKKTEPAVQSEHCNQAIVCPTNRRIYLPRSLSLSLSLSLMATLRAQCPETRPTTQCHCGALCPPCSATPQLQSKSNSFP